MQKKPIREALVEKAAEMQRGADSELHRAESSALKALTGEGDDGNAKWIAVEAWGASKAYGHAAKALDEMRRAAERGDIG